MIENNQRIHDAIKLVEDQLKLKLEIKPEDQEKNPGQYYFLISKRGLAKKHGTLTFQPFSNRPNTSENVFATKDGKADFQEYMNFTKAYGLSKNRKQSDPIDFNDILWQTKLIKVLIQYSKYQPD
tara:strand:- start:66 stop:440 length:375 start_codon:yes stop_codon:yes gene_type:complete